MSISCATVVRATSSTRTFSSLFAARMVAAPAALSFISRPFVMQLSVLLTLQHHSGAASSLATTTSPLKPPALWWGLLSRLCFVAGCQAACASFAHCASLCCFPARTCGVFLVVGLPGL